MSMPVGIRVWTLWCMAEVLILSAGSVGSGQVPSGKSDLLTFLDCRSLACGSRLNKMSMAKQNKRGQG